MSALRSRHVATSIIHQQRHVPEVWVNRLSALLKIPARSIWTQAAGRSDSCHLNDVNIILNPFHFVLFWCRMGHKQRSPWWWKLVWPIHLDCLPTRSVWLSTIILPAWTLSLFILRYLSAPWLSSWKPGASHTDTVGCLVLRYQTLSSTDHADVFDKLGPRTFWINNNSITRMPLVLWVYVLYVLLYIYLSVVLGLRLELVTVGLSLIHFRAAQLIEF